MRGYLVKRIITHILLITGVCLAIPAMVLMAQDDPEPSEPPEFIGTRDCNDCHRDITNAHELTPHAWTMVEIEDDLDLEDNPIVADFASGIEIRIVTFPGEDAARSFGVPDVAFSLGAGRNIQAYLYEAEEGVYYVFPAQWNVAAATWEPLELAESWPDDAYAFGEKCAGCHTVGLDTETYEWEEAAVMCEACHGPGLAHVEAADDAGRSIDAEERADISDKINLALGGQACGQCHSRGLSSDGIHPYPTNYYPGQTDLGEGFNLVDPEGDTHWWSTGHARLPNMQYNEWLNSTHPNALASAQESEEFGPNCLTCHSVAQQLVDLRLANEEIDPETVNPSELSEAQPYGVTCASCHDPHLVIDGDPMPPEGSLLRDDDYSLCVGCHQDSDITEGIHHPVRQVFEGWPILEGVNVQPSPHFTAEGPICITCHMTTVPTYNGERNNHNFEIIAPGAVADVDGLQDTCTRCHDESPQALQRLIHDLQNGTRQRIENARTTTSDETAEWVFTALDIVEYEGSFGIHNYKYTNDLLRNVELELGLVETSLTQADVSAQIDAALPDVERPDLQPADEPLITFGSLTTATIVLLILAAGILVFAAFEFFTSN